MKTHRYIAYKVKNLVFDIIAGIFVIFASVVIHVSKADYDTWPSMEDMKNTKINLEKVG